MENLEHDYCYGCMKHTQNPDHMCGECGYDINTYQVGPHHLVPGTVLHDRYMVGRVLGEGGFGITYVGRDTLLDLKVAVKEFFMNGFVNRNNTVSSTVQANVGASEELFLKNKGRFIEEARVLAKFADQDGIVGIRDFFNENNTAYMVMDFLEGKTLRAFLGENGTMAEKKVIEIMRPVMISLQNVHDNNVIHRDISPDNIMMLKNSRIKLLDFGAAREVSKSDMHSLSVILKPGYAPEEQYRSKGTQGPWTDVYALCATMYRCISGITPDDAMERLFEDKVQPLDTVSPCSPSVSSVIMKGLSVRRDGRYQSIRELQSDLEQALRNPAFRAVPNAAKRAETAPAKQDATVYAGAVSQAPQRPVQNAGSRQVPSQQPPAQQVPAGRISQPQSRPQQTPVRQHSQPQAQRQTPVQPTARQSQPQVQQRQPQTVPPKAQVPQAPRPSVQGRQTQPQTVPQSAPARNTQPQQRAAQVQKTQPQAGQRSVPVQQTPPQTKQQTVPQVQPQAPVQPQGKARKTGFPKWIIPVGIAVLLSIIGMIIGIASANHDKNRNASMNAGAVPEIFSDYVFALNDMKFRLPASYADFQKGGWEFADESSSNIVLKPGESVSGIKLKNHEGLITVTFYNPTQYSLLMMDTEIEYVGAWASELNQYRVGSETNVMRTGWQNNDFLFATEGSNTSELKNVFGKPIGHTYISRVDDEHFVRITTESGRISAIELHNRSETAVDTSGFMDAAPAYIYADVSGPGANSDGMPYLLALLDSNFEIVDYYGLGVQLKEYTAGGFEIIGNPDYIGPGEHIVVDVYDESTITIRATITNPFEQPLLFEECFVTQLDTNNADPGDGYWVVYETEKEYVVGQAMEVQDDGTNITTGGFKKMTDSDNTFKMWHEATGGIFTLTYDPETRYIKNVVIDAEEYAMNYEFF